MKSLGSHITQPRGINLLHNDKQGMLKQSATPVMQNQIGQYLALSTPRARRLKCVKMKSPGSQIAPS